MKRCPTCQKTFDDAMRFCQADGTPLVEDKTPADPYKTMVASKEDIQSALGSQPASGPAGIGAPEEEPLEIPSAPLSARPESEFETKLAAKDEPEVIEIPPLTESTEEEAPAAGAPPMSYGVPSAPPSPFTAPQGSSGAGDFPTTPPIPSPFGGSRPAVPDTPAQFSEPEPVEPVYAEPEPVPPAYSEPERVPATPQFSEPEPARAFNPFEQQASPAAPIAQSEWSQPAPPSGQGGQFNPPAPGQKLNQTLPIVSLIAGILSLCCWISPVTGIVAIIAGFLGMKNANNDPSRYGGKTLAIVGLILGAIFFLIGLAYWIFVLFFNGAAWVLEMLNRMQ